MLKRYILVTWLQNACDHIVMLILLDAHHNLWQQCLLPSALDQICLDSSHIVPSLSHQVQNLAGKFVHSLEIGLGQRYVKLVLELQ